MSFKSLFFEINFLQDTDMKKIGEKSGESRNYKFLKCHHSGAYIPGKGVSNPEEKKNNC